MSDAADPLENLLWLDLPDDIETDMGAFVLDPSIPLPIEPEEDGTMNMESVTWEKVIAAALLVLANRPSHEHADYYRSFLAALRPELETELTAAADTLIGEGDWDRAEDILLALRGFRPDSIEARFAMAGFYDRRAERDRKSGNQAQADSLEKSAEAAYNEILSDADAPAAAWYRAGIFRYRRGDFMKAADTLEAFLDIAPGGEETEEARRIVRLCREEGQADELYQTAYAALTAGSIDEGTELARQFRDRKPGGWPGWFLLGWGLRLSGAFEEAREALEGARDRGCRESDLYNELAICTRSLGDFDAAAVALEEALRKDPENLKIISNMALVQIERGDRNEAARWLETALTLDPTDAICRKMLDELESDE